MSLPVLFTDDWVTGSPWVGEFLPGTPRYQEFGIYNELLNEPLKLIGYNDKTILFLVIEPANAYRGQMFNIYACQAASPTYVAPLVPLRKPDGSPLPLNDDTIAYTLNNLMYFGPFSSISDEQRQKMMLDWNEKVKADKAAKMEEKTQAVVEANLQLLTAGPDHPLVQEEAIKKGMKRSVTVKTKLES
ncbi:MAG: hypothetical protein E6R03_09560 [Hyphomicrobiaceae bacterium]|nr:MAG: hypothetical protein E6R03_09560 [Hyphomicrobiaceae bacterium]